MVEQAQEKAKNYNKRVQEKIETLTTKSAVESDSLKLKIESKQQSAASRREQKLSQVKTVAAQSAAKRSPSQAAAAGDQ